MPLERGGRLSFDDVGKGNADPERFMRTLKEECLWLQDWTCPLSLMNGLAH
jgi:hypothetical protein